MIVVDTSALLDEAALKLIKSFDDLIIPDLVINELNNIFRHSQKKAKVERAEKVLSRLDYQTVKLDGEGSVDDLILEFSQNHTLCSLDAEMIQKHQGKTITWPELAGVFPIEPGDTIKVHSCRTESANQQVCRTEQDYPVLVEQAHGSVELVLVGKVILRNSGVLIVAKKS